MLVERLSRSFATIVSACAVLFACCALVAACPGVAQAETMDSEVTQDELTEADLQFCMEVHLSQDSFTWTGKPCEPQVTKVTNWSLDEDLIAGSGYEVVGYENNVNIGTGTVTLRSLTPGYTGVWHVAFQIVTPAAGTKVAASLTSDGNVYRVLDSSTVELVKYASKKTSASINKVSFGGRSFKVQRIGAKALKGTKVKKVVLGKNVAVVGAQALAGCKKLTSLTLGTGVTKLGAKMCTGCKKLKKVVLKSGKLAKSKVKGCLKGSKVTTVKCSGVNSVKKTLYRSYFSKANCGRKVSVK